MRQFFYHFKSAIENIQINKMMGFFSLFSLSLTLMIFGVFLLFYNNMQGFAQKMRESVQFSIYLEERIDAKSLQTIKDTLNGDTRIFSATYISKEAALEIFNESFQDKTLIDRLGENPLPASFEVVVKNDFQKVVLLEEIINDFKGLGGVEEVQYGSEWLENLNLFLKLLQVIGVGIGGFLVVAIMTNIANTIRLHFYNRRDEIEIMKLMGATHGFIKIPFFIEGILMGIISSGFSIVLLFLIFYYTKEHIEGFLGTMGSLEGLQFLPLNILCALLIGGSALGGIGSYLSMKHLLRLRNSG